VPVGIDEVELREARDRVPVDLDLRSVGTQELDRVVEALHPDREV
jgi:hypothetical protein